MFIGPNLETEVTTVGLNDQASDPKKGNAEIRSGGMFTSLPPRTNLARKRSVWMCTTMPIRTSVRSRMWPTTGESVNGYVIGVGGFLGIGDHYVAVRPSAVKLSYDAKDKKWHASMDANADQLKAAPEFKYPSNT
jgi:hypothetical protein